jgi:DNA repair exonuclease SbcCD ATPase subunit
MKKIALQKLTLRNFKSIENLTIEFSEKTNIHGKNGSGKTTIFDGFNWLLFGKNSENSTDFNLKPLDKENNPIHNLETEVEGLFFVDGTALTLKRIYREKWTKKKGNEVAELTGHETSFFFNEVPVSLSEYKSKVQEIIDEELSKILTNTLFFNGVLKWNQRREILSKMVGEVSETSIIDSMTNAEELKEILNSGKNIEEEKKTLSAKKKKIKEELEQIPSRIDEVQRTKPAEQDFEQVQAEIDLKEKEFQKIDEEILDSSKLDQNKQAEIDKANSELLTLKNKLNDEKEKARQLIQAEIDSLQKEQTEINSENQKIDSENKASENKLIQIKQKLDSLKTEIDSKRKDWQTENEKLFVLNQNEVCCPTCKRDFENAFEKKEELEKNFNENKLKRLSEISAEGKALSEKMKEFENELNSINTSDIKILKDMKGIQNKINDLIQERNNSTNETILNLETKINSFILPTFERQENAELIQTRNSIKIEIEALKSKLSDKFLIEKAEARTSELIQQQKTLSSEIASIEKIELQIEKFSHLKIKTIEEAVNSKFALVKFKMFEQQLNGGIAETCICTINGVPFADLNTASKINAGLDIINALNYQFGISAPIFIDGRESVTEIIKTENQVVSLIVDEKSESINIL